MIHANLEAAIQAAGSPVKLLRNSQIGPYAFPVVRHEFTNWRDEQASWRESCALFDQSHHMTDLYVEGPDALKLFSDLGVNSFKNFKVNQAKQFVACTPDGYVIGDAILFYLAENKFNLVGRPPAANWVQYHVETGGYNATADRDERSAEGKARRKAYRFQVQGPNALKVMEKVLGETRSRHPVLQHERDQDRGPRCACAAARHGGTARVGIVRTVGRTATRCATRSLRRARSLGIRQVGARTYPTSCLESGWIPSPLPAIYTGEELKAYRQWLTRQ